MSPARTSHDRSLLTKAPLLGLFLEQGFPYTVLWWRHVGGFRKGWHSVKQTHLSNISARNTRTFRDEHRRHVSRHLALSVHTEGGWVKERALVYTSEKNWWLGAAPVGFEALTVPAWTFQTVKLKLQTFLGKDLQQKGDVWAWVATDRPDRPLVQIQGEIKIGSIFMSLHRFVPGG